VTLSQVSLRARVWRARAQVGAPQSFQRFECLFLSLRNVSLPAAADPAGAISESVLSDFNGLRRHFRVVPFFASC
jgi:hypothetical protein